MLTALRIAIGAIAGAALMAVPACLYGQHGGRETGKIAAAKSALERVQKLENNNADFKRLSDRDRCRVFMRDSGLPDSACD